MRPARQRQAHGDGGAAAGRAVQRKRRAVAGRDAAAQRQPQAAAAARPRARFIDHIKRLGHTGQVFGRDAAAGVRHRKDSLALLGPAGHPHARAGHAAAGAAGVGDQIAQQVLPQNTVHADRAPAGREHNRRGGVPRPGPRQRPLHGGKQRAVADRRFGDAALARLKAQQLKQLGAQRFQPPRFAVDVPGRVLHGGGRLRAGAQQPGVAHHAGHGGLEFVGKRGDKVPLALQSRVQVLYPALHGFGHRVKAGAQRADLVAGDDAGALAVFPGGDAPAGRLQAGERGCQPPAEPPGRRAAQHQRERRSRRPPQQQRPARGIHRAEIIRAKQHGVPPGHSQRLGQQQPAFAPAAPDRGLRGPARGSLLLHRARQRRGQCGKQRRTVRKQRQLRAGRGLRRIGLQRRGQPVVAVGLRAIGGAGFILGVHRLLHAVAVAAVLCQRGRAGAGHPGGKAGGGHGQAHRAQGGSQQRKERQRDLVVKPQSGLLTGPGRASL